MLWLILKYIFFFAHFLWIISCCFLWVIYPPILLLQLSTIISWKLNNNKCLITQLELYLFNSTLMQLISKKKNLIEIKKVPLLNRQILYLTTGFNLLQKPLLLIINLYSCNYT